MTSESILVAAAFAQPEEAEAAVQDLGRAGFSQNDFSVVYTDRSHVAEQGLLHGAVFGGIVGGLTGLLFPPLGVLVAAGWILGPLAAGLVGAGIGATAVGAVSGITSALVQVGMPNEVAGRFGEHVHKGDALVIVHTNRELAEQARSILESHHPRTATDSHPEAQPEQGVVVTSVTTPTPQSRS